MGEREPRFIPGPENQPAVAKDALESGTEPQLSYEEEIKKPLNESDRQHFADISENVKKLAELERTNSEWSDCQTLHDIIFRDHILERALYDEALAPEAMQLIHQVREIRSYVAAETVRGIMTRHLPQIEKQVTADVQKSQLPLTLIADLVESGYASTAKLGKTAMRRHLPLILRAIQSERNTDDYERLFSVYTALGYKRDFDKIRKWFNGFLDSQRYVWHDPLKLVTSLHEYESQWLHRWKDESKRSVSLMDDVLNRAGVDRRELLPEWKKQIAVKDQAVVIEENLRQISYLERDYPGSAKMLHEQFGIAHFERYPYDLLAEQYRRRDDVSNRYGIIVYPYDDWNGAFGNNHYYWAKLEESKKYLRDSSLSWNKEDVNIRILEAKSKIDLVKKLVWLDKKYGDKQKISFAMIGGHGTKDSIQFGDIKGEQGHIYTKDLQGTGTERARKFFADGATITLRSCSTGTVGGIGQTLSARLGLKVIAPDKPALSERVNLMKLSDKSLYLYSDFQSYQSNQAKTVFYEGGREQLR